MARKRKTKGTYRIKSNEDCLGCLVDDTSYAKDGMCDPCKKEYDQIRAQWLKDHANPLNLPVTSLNSD